MLAGRNKEKSFRFARTNLCSLSPRLVPQNWSRDCGIFYESNKHDIWQASATTRDEKRNEPERYLKFTFHSWMCKQALLAPKIATTSSITSKRFWRNMHISFGAVQQILAGARAYFASFLFSLSQNLILYARLTSRCLLCKPKLNEHKCLIMRRDSIDI